MSENDKLSFSHLWQLKTFFLRALRQQIDFPAVSFSQPSLDSFSLWIGRIKWRNEWDGSRGRRNTSSDGGARVRNHVGGLLICLAEAWLCIRVPINIPCQLWRLFINFLLSSLGSPLLFLLCILLDVYSSERKVTQWKSVLQGHH